MSFEPDIFQVAALIGDKTRSKMLIALLGGKALTATELAVEAGISAQTASSHLSKLLSHQLLQVQKQGRHKYFQLAGSEIAELLEKLLNVSSKLEHSQAATGPADPELRKSRLCYNHLAGELAVLLLEGLKKNEFLEDFKNDLNLSPKGRKLFESFGADVSELNKKRRPLCKYCLDWSERRHHLAGSLGQWILNDILTKGWAEKDLNTRIIRFSGRGLKQFQEAYGM